MSDNSWLDTVRRGLRADLPLAPDIHSGIAFYWTTDTKRLLVWTGEMWSTVAGSDPDDESAPVKAQRALDAAADAAIAASSAFGQSNVAANAALDATTAANAATVAAAAATAQAATVASALAALAAQLPARIQRTVGSSDTNGLVAWTFPTAFAAPPVVQAIVRVTASDPPHNAQIVALTATGVTVKVQRSRSLPAVIALLGTLSNYQPWENAAGVAVHIHAEDA